MKLVDGEELTRRDPHDQPSEYLRVDVARPQRYAGDWLRRLSEGERPRSPEGVKVECHVREENIAVGEKLLADRDSAFQQRVLEKLNHCKAVDMESYGFLKAVYQARRSIHYNPMALVIRGVSDLVNDPENDDMRKAWRPYAAKAAAAFARSVVEQLETMYQIGHCCGQSVTNGAFTH
jgi:nucleoside phosphorylase